MILKIKQIRKQKKMTIEELSLKSGVSPRAISGYEANESDITLGKLQDIAKALEVSIYDLIENQEKREVNESEPEYTKTDIGFQKKYVALLERTLKSHEERMKYLEDELKRRQ